MNIGDEWCELRYRPDKDIYSCVQADKYMFK